MILASRISPIASRVSSRSSLSAARSALDRHDPVLDGALERGLEQRRLVAIAGIDRALGHAGRRADRLDAGALETLFEEQVERLVEQLLVAQRRPPRPPPGGLSCRSTACCHCIRSAHAET